jgi:hypothetical protein
MGYFKAFLFICAALATSSVYAQHMDFNLAPKASKVVKNPYLWTLSATCTITSKDKNKISVHVLGNTGVVNGKNLTVGQSTSVLVENKDSISVSAEPGAQVTLHNMSDDAVQATCST